MFSCLDETEMRDFHVKATHKMALGNVLVSKHIIQTNKQH